MRSYQACFSSMEQVTRIELARSAWKADVLPLNYTCLYLVGKTGFEPATSWSQTRRSAKLSYFPSHCLTKMIKGLLNKGSNLHAIILYYNQSS